MIFFNKKFIVLINITYFSLDIGNTGISWSMGFVDNLVFIHILFKKGC